jgi:hypothetical protein
LEERYVSKQNNKVFVTAFLRTNGGGNLCFLVLAKKLMKSYIWSIAFCGALTWTLQKADHKCPQSFEMWCWREMEEINLIDSVKNGEVLHRVKEEWNILRTIKEERLTGLVTPCIGTATKTHY